MTVPAPLDQTAEERALALRLARLGPHGEPSPQLDATVLAAARAALDEQPRSTYRSRRWPVALGVAASLVLAVVVALRLRPLPPGSSADLAAPTRAAAVKPAPPAAEPVAAAPVAQVVPEAASDAGVVLESPPPPPQPAPRRAAKTVAPPGPAPELQVDTEVAPPVILDAPAAAAAAAAPPSAPTPEAVERKVDAAPAGNQAAELDRAAMSDDQPEASDEPLDSMPPATADAPGVRDAWLSRIRALIDSGDVTGGRRSLRAFVERYPDYPLPEDLRALQQ